MKKVCGKIKNFKQKVKKYLRKNDEKIKTLQKHDKNNEKIDYSLTKKPYHSKINKTETKMKKRKNWKKVNVLLSNHKLSYNCSDH